LYKFLLHLPQSVELRPLLGPGFCAFCDATVPSPGSEIRSPAPNSVFPSLTRLGAPLPFISSGDFFPCLSCLYSFCGESFVRGVPDFKTQHQMTFPVHLFGQQPPCHHSPPEPLHFFFYSSSDCCCRTLRLFTIPLVGGPRFSQLATKSKLLLALVTALSPVL